MGYFRADNTCTGKYTGGNRFCHDRSARNEAGRAAGYGAAANLRAGNGIRDASRIFHIPSARCFRGTVHIQALGHYRDTPCHTAAGDIPYTGYDRCSRDSRTACYAASRDGDNASHRR